jgi:AcrR family transcriptional regulator
MEGVGLRRDAAVNRDKVLAAAAAAIRREGDGVPLATIAADAGVGVGTLYRRYPSRASLLAALTHRSFEMVLGAAQSAGAVDDPLSALGDFLERTIDHGPDLILPLHGGPQPLTEETIALRAEVHRTVAEVIGRGQEAGAIRADVTAYDVIVLGALLAQPLPNVPDWPRVARHQAAIYLAGLTVRPTEPGAGATTPRRRSR